MKVQYYLSFLFLCFTQLTPSVCNAADTTLGLIGRIQVIEQILKRSVIASPDSCDGLGKGWKAYIEAEGRFLLGTGKSYQAGESGGQPSVLLHPDHLPKHHHGIRMHDSSGSSETSGHGMGSEGGLRGRLFITPSPKVPLARTLDDNSGGEKEIDIMPPYIPVHFCKFNLITND